MAAPMADTTAEVNRGGKLGAVAGRTVAWLVEMTAADIREEVEVEHRDLTGKSRLSVGGSMRT